MTRPIRIGTRQSELALWQARTIGDSLGVPYELVPVTTHGDRDLTSPLEVIGGQGVFVKEVQSAVLRGEADLAVHSAKDLPSAQVDGLSIVACPRRGDARDSLVGARLDDLPGGAVVATGSARRRALLLRKRPDLEIVHTRGNIRTRLERRQGAAAVMVAFAALQRLGLSDLADQVFEIGDFCPQVAQGAIAVEARTGDEHVLETAAEINDPATAAEVTAERAMLAELGTGCALPVGAHARSLDGLIEIYAMIASLDGRRLVEATERGRDATSVGSAVGKRLLAEGGAELLAEVQLPADGWADD
ncbi:MAG: hydroxymethylbilane synthase [Actinomycetota bacterium]|nr:hydroxymethylbilane synthase [Actinomycetota bacterium]